MPPHDNQKSPEIFIFFGLIATGKSTIAQAWAWQEQLRCYNSDWVRKELAGVDPTSTHHESIDVGIYDKDFSIKTYATLLDRAAARIRQGDSVILDASYQYERNRQDVKDLARRLGCRVFFILCQCPETEMKRRMDLRSLDPAAVTEGPAEDVLADLNEKIIAIREKNQNL
jgi:predicted kinase